jgi:2-oxoisovalerate dehydrogenase E1 component alpha subunit
MSSVVETPVAALADPGDLTEDDLRRMYRTMVTGRLLAERFWILSRQGKTHFVITSQGHEAAQVGSAMAMKRGTDYLYTYYRSMSVALTMGFTPYDLLLGVLGKRDDPYSGGRQLPNHPSSVEWRMPTGSSSVATQMAHAVGSAYAARVKGEDFVAISYSGEGATAKGDFHETAAIASIHKLPVIFFIENNHYAISVPEQYELPEGGVASRVKAGYAMHAEAIDGTDVIAVYNATREARERALRGEGPTLIEANCVRLVAHSSDDNDRYRTDEMRNELKKYDPVPRMRTFLIERGVLTEESDADLVKEVTAEIRESLDRAEAAPAALPEEARLHIFAEEGDA